ncbi:uncharacterized protein LOC132196083 [Neocloeon triangulifer]|uniref:uncharacterized protein LOC132196083 n=1 Tax=Neocloeon triangulifer TaxID=2078957 RepID=UPI00286F3968|nr:uncharacterized protein LOC132196083 [Neocloeon triangulifer]
MTDSESSDDDYTSEVANEALKLIQTANHLIELGYQEEEISNKRKAAVAKLQKKKLRLLFNVKQALDGRGKSRSIWIQAELNGGTGYWEQVMPHLCDERFQKAFRLSKTSFYELVGELKPFMEKTDTNFRKAIPMDKRVAIAIYCLKSTCTPEDVSNIFRVGVSTVSEILHEFCHYVNEILLKRYVKFPGTQEERKKIVEDFMTLWQFPNTFGAIDGTHIPIIAPSENPEDYWNYKSYHSIVVLAAVDAKGCFIYANVGRPGKANDAGIFNDTSLKESLVNQIGIDHNLHMIGDGAFPLMQSLMKPFRIRPGMPLMEENFNKRLSRARVIVEDAFGRLKGRFRLLAKRADYSVLNMINIVNACLVLHNFCESKKHRYWSEWDDKLKELLKKYPQPPNADAKNTPSSLAVAKRLKLAECLASDYVSYE